MAGFLGITAASEHLESHPVNASPDQWHRIHFSRFFTYPNPSLSSTCPSLVPFQRRHGPIHGTWISTSSPAASLLIINHRSTSDPILYVCLQDKILVSPWLWIVLDDSRDLFNFVNMFFIFKWFHVFAKISFYNWITLFMINILAVDFSYVSVCQCLLELLFWATVITIIIIELSF